MIETRAHRLALVLVASTLALLAGRGAALAGSPPPAVQQYVETIPTSQGSRPAANPLSPPTQQASIGGGDSHTLLVVVLLAVGIPAVLAAAFATTRRRRA